VTEKVVGEDVDVFKGFAKEAGRNVTSGMKWNGSTATVNMPKLLMGSLLPDLLKSECR